MISLIRMERWLLFITLAVIVLPVSAEIGPIGIAPFMIPLALLLAAWCVRLGRGSTLSIGALNHFWPLLFVGLMLTISSLIADQSINPDLMIWLAGLGVMLYASQNFALVFGFRTIVVFLAFILIIETGLASIQFFTNSYIGKATAYFGETQDVTEEIKQIAQGAIFRPVGTLSVPNLLGTWLVMGSVVLYATIRWHPRISRLSFSVFGLLILLSLVILVLSTSRANLAVLIISFFGLEVLVNLKLKLHRWGKMLLGLSGCAAILGALAMTAMIGEFNEGISQSTLGKGIVYRLENIEDSLAFRLYQYGSALSATLAFPVVGMGFGNSEQLWYLFDIDIPEHFHYRPHNIYLIIALEAGLIGGIVFLGTVLHLLIKYLQQWRHYNWKGHTVWIGAFVFLVLGLVYITPLSRGLWPFMCFWLGLLMAILRPSFRIIPECHRQS